MSRSLGNSSLAVAWVCGIHTAHGKCVQNFGRETNCLHEGNKDRLNSGSAFCVRFKTVREENTLRVSENRVLRGVFGRRGRKWQEAEEDCITRSFITCKHHQMLLA